MLELQGLQRRYQDIQDLGGEVYFVGPELDRNALRYMEKGQATIPVLLDEEGQAMDAFRISYEMPEYLRQDFGDDRFLQVNPKTGWTLPIPATFVIAPDGTVRARWVSADYRYRMEPDHVVEAVRAAGGGERPA